MCLRGRSQHAAVLFKGEGAKCFRPSQHPACPHHPPALHLSAIQCDTGSCWDTSLSQDGCRVMNSSRSQSADLYRCGGEGTDSKEDATGSMRVSFIRKIKFIHVCLSTVSHIYIHSGTYFPFFLHFPYPLSSSPVLFLHHPYFSALRSVVHTDSYSHSGFQSTNGFTSQPQRRRRRRRRRMGQELLLPLRHLRRLR